MFTSIIILTHNNFQYTRLCVESIRQYTTPGTYEMIVVDNCSTDDTRSWLREQSDISVIYNKYNKGFPEGCNQGINIARGDNILLLNNDVIVTPNWLENLVNALYSAHDVGAVGPTTNAASYWQSIPTSYQTVDEMQAFAASYNQSNASLWEDRIKLIGFCMLIKSDVVKSIGNLDERFSPGNFEDDDYSLRIGMAGYRLLYCKDTFIHHFGSTSWRENIDEFLNLLRTNERKFIDKWGFSPSTALDPHMDLLGEIPPSSKPQLRVLQFNCGVGAGLLQTKNRYPQAEVYGVESIANAASVARQVVGAQIYETTDYGKAISALGGHKFDFIIAPFVLEELSNPEFFLNTARQLLEPDGTLLLKIRDNSYIVDESVTSTQNASPPRGLNRHAIISLLQGAGFTNSNITALKNPREDGAVIDESLWLVKVQLGRAPTDPGLKSNNPVDMSAFLRRKFLLNRIEFDVDRETSILYLLDPVVKGNETLQDVIADIENYAIEPLSLVSVISDYLRSNNYKTFSEFFLQQFMARKGTSDRASM